MGKKIGLALGGGGARGWSHVGVLRALEKHDIPIDYIAGTSIGALVGAVYVKSALSELEKLADEMDTSTLLSLMDVSFPGLGLIDGEQVRKFLTQYLLDTQIEDCFIPFQCVATNFLSKQEVIFSSGSMVNAIRASISIPGIFVPLKHENTYLVDGGVINPVPVNVVRKMGADIVIAVNLNRDPKTLDQSNHQPDKQNETDQSTEDQSTDAEVNEAQQESAEEASERDMSTGSQSPEDQSFTQRLVDRYKTLTEVLQDKVDDWMPDPETGMNIFDVIGNSINMMEQQITHSQLQIHRPDILIEPNLMEFGVFDFAQAKPLIQRGYDATEAIIPDLKSTLSDEAITPSD